EYNNTIRDLVGVDFKPAKDFPADDVGYGFDSIGDVLSLPPLLMEKYLNAAEDIVERAWKSSELKKRILTRKPEDAGPVRAILRDSATRAFRRPVMEPELKRLLGLVQKARDQGDSAEEGIKVALQAVLVSPHFLFRIETDPPPRERTGVRTLNDWELASR